MKDGYPQALCGVTCLEGGFLGTGQQWEQQVADRLPTCGRCKARLDAINEHANKRLEPALEEEFADGHAN